LALFCRALRCSRDDGPDEGGDLNLLHDPGHAQRLALRVRTQLQRPSTGRLARPTTKNVWKPALGKAELPGVLRIHDLRHTSAALLISRGAHPEAIKRHLGHSSIVVTIDVYGHLFLSEAETLAQALDDLYAQHQTDKRRTKPGAVDPGKQAGYSDNPMAPGFPAVGPVGLEPTTNGLKVRCSAN